MTNETEATNEARSSGSVLNDGLGRYYVGNTPQCFCHWETCNCNDWAVFKSGEVVKTFFRKSDAEEFVNNMNAAHNATELRGLPDGGKIG